MNSEIKQKWLVALRSGKYTQITGTLRKSRYECCVLGVLCSVSGVKWKKFQKKETDKTKHYYLVGPDGQPTQRAILDENIRLRLGLTPREDGHMVSLLRYNDLGYSFEDLANMIEDIFIV